jgi:hypothetical protein
MSIKGSIDELDRIKAEIARNNSQNRILRKRAGVLEEQITNYLQSKSQAGVKYNGRTIILETKERRGRKFKAQRQRDVVALLEQLGVDEPTEAYKQLLDAQKGEVMEHHKLKIKKIKEVR